MKLAGTSYLHGLCAFVSLSPNWTALTNLSEAGRMGAYTHQSLWLVNELLP